VVVDEVRGTGIVRHELQYEGFVAAVGQRKEVAEAIDRHVAAHFGPVEFVLHEIASHLVGIHVYVIGPTAERPYQTLITSGMSERPMAVPEEQGINPYAELMLCLPADWPLRQTALQDERTGWPVRVLKQVARLPHEYATWIGEWHSVPNGDPAMPYAPGTPFAGVVVTPILNVRPEARTIDVGDGTRIDLLALVPLHPAEVELKVSQGTNTLIAVLDRGRINELLNPTRPSLV
jgi:hypothetical protein